MLSSSHISEMIGGQQVMFANNAQFSQQIGARVGTSPAWAGMGGMSAPSFGRSGYRGQDLWLTENNSPGGYGAKMVGGMGQAIPGAVAGLSMAAGFGLLGHTAGYLDPFTGVSRAFASGIAGSGGTFGGTMGAIGSAVQAGGLRAGIATVGGGLAAAMLPAAGYMAAGQAISYLGGNIYQGAQNISQVGAMTQQYFTPAFGESGSRPGGGMARDQIQAVTNIIREIASQDTMTSMKDVMKLVNDAGQLGMLQGVSNTQQFSDRFKKIVSQVRDVAKVMGSSLEEAMPLFSQMHGMGLWRASDVMGAAFALKTVGSQAAPQMMQAMQYGSQRSWAMGGSLAGGAALGRNQFMNISSAVKAGTLTDEQITEMTGGVGGVEGQRLLANNMTTAIQNMSQTPIGRLSMAGLGEVVDGKFTGRVDRKRLNAMLSGELDLSDLKRMGHGNASTRDAKASFVFREEQLGQELASIGGEELLARQWQMGLQRAGFGGASEEIQGIMLQKMSGMNKRDTMMVQKLIQDLPRMQEARTKREIDSLRSIYQQAEEKQNRSWEGFKQAIGQIADDKLASPIQQVAEKLTTGVNESMDKLTDWIFSRHREMSLSTSDRMRVLQKGGLGGAGADSRQRMFGAAALQEHFDPTVTSRMRQSGEFFSSIGASLTRTLWGEETGLGSRGELLLDAGAIAKRGATGAGDILVRGTGADGWQVSQQEARRTIERARMLAAPSMSKLLGNSPQAEESIKRVREALQTTLGDARTIAKLSDARRGATGPGNYARTLIAEIEKRNPDAFSGLADKEAALALAQQSAGPHQLHADFKKMAEGLNADVLSYGSERMDQYVNEGVQSALGSLKSAMPMKTGLAKALPLIGSALPLVGGAVSMGASLREDFGMSDVELRNILSSEIGAELIDFAKSGATGMKSFPKLNEAYKKGDNKGLNSIVEALGRMSPEQLEKFAGDKGAGRVAHEKQARVWHDVQKERASIAGAELSQVGDLGLSDGTRGEYEKILKLYQSSDYNDHLEAANLAEKLGVKLKGSKELDLLGGAGAVGGQVRGFGAIAGDALKVGMSKSQFQNMMQKTGLAGTATLLTPEDQDYITKSFAGDGKLDANEKARIGDMLTKANRVGFQDSRAGRQNTTEELAKTLTGFADASKNFVMAVNAAIPNLNEQMVRTLTKYTESLSKDGTGKAP